MANTVVRYKERPNESIRNFLTLIFKHKIKILLMFSTVVLISLIASFAIPPVYEAKSTVLIKFGREYLSRPEVGSAQPLMALNQEEVMNSEIQIITSRDLIKKVIETLKIENMYPELLKDPPGDIKPIDLAITTFTNNLNVEGVRKSSVLEVTFQHNNPQIAAKAVNTLVDFYKEKHLQVFSNPHSSFLEGQVASLRQKLNDTESKMQSFKQKNRVYSLDEQRTLLLKQRTDLDTDLINTRNSVNELRNKVASLKAQIRNLEQSKNLYTPTERDRIIVDARSKLLALEISEQELLRKYKESNKLVVDTRKEIQMVKNFLKDQEREIHSKVLTGSVVYQDAQKTLVISEADLSAQKGRLASLYGQLAQLDGQLRSLDLQEKGMQNLKRELTINEKNFQTYDDRMEEARISDDMNRLKLANISVIEAATTPPKPVKPNKLLNVALGIIFGVLSGIGLAYLSEQNSQALISPESIEKRLNLAVLAAIPYKD